MKKIHLAIGLLGIVFFILSGQYMNIIVGDMPNRPDIERMAWRANHLYILYISLAHFFIGLYMQAMNVNGAKNAQHVGSLFFIASFIILLGAFLNEPASASFARPLSFFGAVAALAGAGFHGLSAILEKRNSSG